MATVMEVRRSRFAGNLVAECPACHAVWAYWDEEDLDDDGNCVCHCKEGLE